MEGGDRLKKMVGDWRLQRRNPKERPLVRLPEEKTEEREVAETAAAAPQSEPEKEPPVKHVRLTDRDRQMMGMLATVRYLTLAQLARLLFAARSTINLHKRLLALAGEGRHGLRQPYLKKLSYRSWEGTPQTAWALTPLGYAVAASVLPAPPHMPKAVGANFIEHGLLLNELYVQLLELPLNAALVAAKGRAGLQARPSRSFNKAKAGLYARAATTGFRWHSHDEVRLPWREFSKGQKKEVDRLIRPDATLEVPGPFVRRGSWGTHAYAGRRFFVEAETGSQTLVAMSDTKPGATLNKLERYDSFFVKDVGPGIERRTWYEAQFPDNYEPTVLFLVPSAARAASVNKVIARELVRDGSRRHTQALAVTAAEAVARLQIPIEGVTPAAPTPGSAPAALPSARPPATVDELALLIRYAVDCTEVIREARRERLMVALPKPEYPASRSAFEALLKRLTTSEGTDDRPWL